MQILAAIDVGSNAMRIMVGRIVYDGKVEVIENLRLPVRLGQDSFTLMYLRSGHLKNVRDFFRMCSR